MGRRFTSAPLAAGALVATAAIGAARDGGEPCPNVGTRWVPQKLASVGGVQCPSAEFRLTIGFDQVGGQIRMKFSGCPSFLVFRPGHSETVPRANYEVEGPQKVHWWKQEYEADCGGVFSSPSCKPRREPTELAHAEDHWTQRVCGAQ